MRTAINYLCISILEFNLDRDGSYSSWDFNLCISILEFKFLLTILIEASDGIYVFLY